MPNQRIYNGRAVNWGLGETEKGTEQVAVTFVITTQGADIESITWYGYFSEKTWERTIESLRICGWKNDDLSNLDGLNENEVQLVIEDEEYNGKLYTKVKWVNRTGGLAMKAPLQGKRATDFATSMRERIRALDASGGKKPAGRSGAVSPEPPPHTDDDFSVPL